MTPPLVNLKIVLTIARKELVDSLRDRRTLVTMLLLPMVIYSGSILVSAEVAMSEKQAADEQIFRLASLTPLPKRLVQDFQELEGFEFKSSIKSTFASTASASDAKLQEIAKTSIEENDIDFLIVPSSTAAFALDTLRTAKLTLYFDQTRPYAQEGVERLREQIRSISSTIREERLEGLGLDESTIQPVRLSVHSISSSSDVGGHAASMLLPFLLLFFIALSSFYPAVDLTAGEKERGTLATLLTTPITAVEIVFGKYLAVVSIGTLTGLLNVGAMGLTLWRALGSSEDKSKLPLPDIGLSEIFALLVAVVLTAMLLGGIMLVSAALARSFRDANNLLTPVLFIALTPAIFAILPRSSLTAKWAAVPIANCVLLMKGILTKDWALSAAFVVVISTAAYTALLLILAARIFSDERALFSLEGPRADFSHVFSEPPQPGLGAAFTLVAIIFIGNYYGGLLIESWSVSLGIITNQLLFQFIPALGLAYWMRHRTPFKSNLGIAQPSQASKAYAAGTLFGLGAWLGISTPILWLQEILIPGMKKSAESLSDALGINDTPLPLLIFSLAVVPAIVEEISFRGVIFGQLKARLSINSALILQAVLFGIVHGSIYRFFPTACLGLVLGWLALKTKSIWPGVIAHLLTNGIAVVLGTQVDANVVESLSEPNYWALLGLFLVFLGITVARVSVQTKSNLPTKDGGG